MTDPLETRRYLVTAAGIGEIPPSMEGGHGLTVITLAAAAVPCILVVPSGAVVSADTPAVVPAPEERAMTDPLDTLRRIAATPTDFSVVFRHVRDLAAAVLALHERGQAPTTDAAAEARGYRRGLEAAMVRCINTLGGTSSDCARAIRDLIPPGPH